MQFVVWIEMVIAGKSVAVQRVAAVERNGVNAPAELGLTLEDGKTILNGIQQDILQTQVDIQSGLCRARIEWVSANPCAGPQRAHISCCRFAVQCSTADSRHSFK